MTAMPPAETLEASARRIGHHAWIEQSLFATLGAWVSSTPEPAAKALLAELSLHHAWRAQLWDGLLPAVPHLAADDLVVSPTGDDAFPAPPSDGSTAARLAWLCDEELPALLDRYADHLARTTPVTDGPTIRVLGLVTADVGRDLDGARGALAALSVQGRGLAPDL
jgi:hypothetical protein